MPSVIGDRDIKHNKDAKVTFQPQTNGNGSSVQVERSLLRAKRKHDGDQQTSSEQANLKTVTSKPSIREHAHLHSYHNDKGSLQPTAAPKEEGSFVEQKQKSLLQTRCRLPIWPYASLIRRSLAPDGIGSHFNDVLILVGETGSGKSTQVPQFLVTEPWCPGIIGITEPRRVAAVSLARRVAQEMGTTLGTASPSSRVGYSVRFDTNVAKSCKVKYLTEGMLLQEMLHDPWLKNYSVIIVDEVHERGLDCDLVLGFLKRIVQSRDGGTSKGSPRHAVGRLKVIIMSATADVAKLQNFFAFHDSIGTTDITSPSADLDVEDLLSETSWNGLSSGDEDGPPVSTAHSNVKTLRPPEQTSLNGSGEQFETLPTCIVEGRQHPVEIHYLPQPVSDWTEAAAAVIFQIHHQEPLPGDVLTFCTGQTTVESLERHINSLAAGLGPNVPKLQALPLFAALPQAAQQSIFYPAPANTRKVILATNIAETSVTIPGVRFVVDSGLAKVKEFRAHLNLESLLVKPISKSSAIQRAGRAGREAKGKCYRLYTEHEYMKLELNTMPEILRCDLAAAVVKMKSRQVENIYEFPLLDPPKVDVLRKALLQLIRLEALDRNGRISQIGLQMAQLPLSPSLARVLITASDAAMDCVLPIIDIISALTVENIFIPTPSEERQEEAATARQDLQRREGDHLTLLATVQAYAMEHTDRKQWCRQRLVSHRAMRTVMDVRKQLRLQSVRQKILPKSTLTEDKPCHLTSTMSGKILKCFLTGFASNTARLMPDGSYRTNEGNHTIAIHPSSVLHGRKVEAILYNEFVFTTKTYARGASAIQMNWYGELIA